MNFGLFGRESGAGRAVFFGGESMEAAAAEVDGLPSQEKGLTAGVFAVAAPMERLAFLTADGQSATPLEQEAAIGADDLLEASFLDRLLLVRGCVGRLRFHTPRGRAYATGFLVAPGLLLTNHHVFADAAAARGAVVEFDYRFDVAGRLPASANEFALEPERFFVSDAALDFAAVALADTGLLAGRIAERGHLRLIPEPGKAKVGEFVTIVQHPDGEPMRIALRENQVVRLQDDGPFIEYAADTAHGSSGAPVFNDSLQVVALHSKGRIRRDDRGFYALKRGGFVESLDGIGEADVIWDANVGFRVSRIAPALVSAAQARDPEFARVIEAAMRGGDVLGASVAEAKEAAGAPEPAGRSFASEVREGRTMSEDERGVAISGMPRSATGRSGEVVVPLELRISISLPGGSSGQAVWRPDAASTPVGLEAEAFPMRIPVIYDGLEERLGFQDGFLELGSAAPGPRLTKSGRAVAAPLLDGSGHELRYSHFSVWMHRERRLALYTASNVDWRARAKVVDGRPTSRKALAGFPEKPEYAEQWVADPRIAVAHQLPDLFYSEDRGAFDKGHLVRRDDVCWGTKYEEIQMANGDTYHVTNCSPQIKPFNQGQWGDENWGDLESLVEKSTRAAAERAIVYAGPVLRPDDRWFRGRDDAGPVRIQIPSSFWKIVVVRRAEGADAYGFVLSQDVRPITEAEFRVTPEWLPALTPIADIASRLRGWLDLSELEACDRYEEARSALG